jgi:hypothetical protein
MCTVTGSMAMAKAMAATCGMLWWHFSVSIIGDRTLPNCRAMVSVVALSAASITGLSRGSVYELEVDLSGLGSEEKAKPVCAYATKVVASTRVTAMLQFFPDTGRGGIVKSQAKFPVRCGYVRAKVGRWQGREGPGMPAWLEP